MGWFYAKYGKQEGPVDLESLRSRIRSGELSSTDLVWREGMPMWMAAGKVAELQPPAGASPVAPAAAVGPVAPQPAPGTGYPVPPATSGLAVASLVCGIVGLVLCYVHAVAAVPAVICGHMALNQINKSPVPTGGRGMAIAGLVTGYIGVVFQVLMIGFIVFAVISGGM